MLHITGQLGGPSGRGEMTRTSGALLVAALTLGAGTSSADAAGLDTIDSFGVGGSR